MSLSLPDLLLLPTIWLKSLIGFSASAAACAVLDSSKDTAISSGVVTVEPTPKVKVVLKYPDIIVLAVSRDSVILSIVPATGTSSEKKKTTAKCLRSIETT